MGMINKERRSDCGQSPVGGVEEGVGGLVIDNPNVTILQVADQLDLNPRGVAKHFKHFKKKVLFAVLDSIKAGVGKLWDSCSGRYRVI